MTEDPGSFARWLNAYIPSVFKNYAELARALGVPQSTVTRWLTRGTVPSVPMLYKISEVTGSDPANLLKMAGHDAPQRRRRRQP